MKKRHLSFLLILFGLAGSAQQTMVSRLSELPVVNDSRLPGADWLLDPSAYKAEVFHGKGVNDLVISNGLVERSFRVTPNLACYSFRNLRTGEEMLRAVKPEAILTIDGKTIHVGGLDGQFEYGYTRYEWLDQFTAGTSDFRVTDFKVSKIQPSMDWTPQRWVPAAIWPPEGKELCFFFASDQYPGIEVEIHYELFDGIPLISKWFTVRNNSLHSIILNKFVSETLAFVEPEISVDRLSQWNEPNIMISSDYSFMGMTPKSANRIANWVTDSAFTSQVNYEMKTPCLLECRPPEGPETAILKNGSFSSFRSYELIFDSYDRERKGLTERKMYRLLAPWAMENPIFMHLTSSDPEVLKTAVDQCVNTGFEMIIFSFGSRLNMESTDTSYIRTMAELREYAGKKGIELGGYSLLASRRINDDEDVINPATGKTGGAIFGNSPCLQSNWGISYFRNLKNFIDKTGFRLLEHDGSYPGDLCASTKHPGHQGPGDSQWSQWKEIADFYKWCRSRDIYLNVPDWYFLAGSNKTGIGYRETNWSLPRDRQIMLGRQNLYDGTWEKTPSMGWTFVPLTEYQGGGEVATLEPLSKHLAEYQAHLAQNFGAGVQACYRGSRLYDTEDTRKLVAGWVSWYKKYREILNSDIIHLRRPDGRDWDGFMHVNPALREKGFLMLFNPLDTPITRMIGIPLYYTGLQNKVSIREKEDKPVTYFQATDQKIILKASIPANGFTWFVIE